MKIEFQNSTRVVSPLIEVIDKENFEYRGIEYLLKGGMYFTWL